MAKQGGLERFGFVRKRNSAGEPAQSSDRSSAKPDGDSSDSTSKNSGHGSKFNKKWLDKYKWLEYSEEKGLDFRP